KNINIKLIQASEVRLLSQVSTFNDLLSKAFEFFGENEEKDFFIQNIKFQYTDLEGDLITFSTEEEWKALLKNLEVKTLKVSIILKEMENKVDFRLKRCKMFRENGFPCRRSICFKGFKDNFEKVDENLESKEDIRPKRWE